MVVATLQPWAEISERLRRIRTRQAEIRQRLGRICSVKKIAPELETPALIEQGDDKGFS